MISFKMKKEIYLSSCPVDIGRILLFTGEQMFLLMGEVWLMHKANTHCTAGERDQRMEKIFCSNFPYLFIKT